MKVEIIGDAKEIAALVLAVQERQEDQEMVETMRNVYGDVTVKRYPKPSTLSKEV